MPRVPAPDGRARDAERTRRRILEAALQEFSAKGISGARVDAIAERATVNKRMLYYYFGSKDGLFRAVLRQRLSDSAAHQASARPSPGPAVGGESLVALDAWMAASPEYVRLLMWEALERGDAPVEEEEARRTIYDGWISRVSADQRAGRLPAGIDPVELVLAELALALFPHAFPQLVRLATGRTSEDPPDEAARLRSLQWLGERLGDPEAGGAGLLD